jgi:hypothetical protein
MSNAPAYSRIASESRAAAASVGESPACEDAPDRGEKIVRLRTNAQAENQKVVGGAGGCTVWLSTCGEGCAAEMARL